MDPGLVRLCMLAILACVLVYVAALVIGVCSKESTLKAMGKANDEAWARHKEFVKSQEEEKSK